MRRLTSPRVRHSVDAPPVVVRAGVGPRVAALIYLRIRKAHVPAEASFATRVNRVFDPPLYAHGRGFVTPRLPVGEPGLVSGALGDVLKFAIVRCIRRCVRGAHLEHALHASCRSRWASLLNL